MPATSADGWDPAAYGNISESGYVFFEASGGAVGRRFPDGREEMVFNRICPDGAASGFTWVDTTVTVQDAIDDAVDRARRAVPAPTLDISPPAETGGIVNLGMWLALVAQDPITVRAEAGPHWAEATVTLASTSWAMGNGDTVTCDGPGEPIVDLDEPGEGPCGYTYRRSSPDDTPYELAVTATWEVGYRSSGPSGTAGIGGSDRVRRLRRRRDPDPRHLQLTPRPGTRPRPVPRSGPVPSRPALRPASLGGSGSNSRDGFRRELADPSTTDGVRAQSSSDAWPAR